MLVVGGVQLGSEWAEVPNYRYFIICFCLLLPLLLYSCTYLDCLAGANPAVSLSAWLGCEGCEGVA